MMLLSIPLILENFKSTAPLQDKPSLQYAALVSHVNFKQVHFAIRFKLLMNLGGSSGKYYAGSFGRSLAELFEDLSEDLLKDF
mgnify:CR=1 FL=1